jgi:hypothetical protein
VRAGLEATATLWPAIALMFAWVWRAAHILDEDGPNRAAAVGWAVRSHCAAWRAAGAVGGAAEHFVRVSRSYWPGLFHCYAVAGLPRTNNDLEHLFGSHRYHEWRASGRKGASPCLVFRGQARLLAAAASRQRCYSAEEFARADRGRHEQLRQQLEARLQRRVQPRRSRRDSEAYLQQLEEQLLQAALPT